MRKIRSVDKNSKGEHGKLWKNLTIIPDKERWASAAQPPIIMVQLMFSGDNTNGTSILRTWHFDTPQEAEDAFKNIRVA